MSAEPVSADEGPVSTDDGVVEEFSFGDVVNGLKSVANTLRLPGMPKIPYAAEDLELPAGVEASEHWQRLAAAVAEAQVHAQALLGDWDQQQHVAKAVVRAAQEQDGPQGSLKNPIDL